MKRFYLAEAFADWGPLIVKPSVSAAGAGLVFLTSQAAASAFQAEFEERGRTQWYLVQPFLPEITGKRRMVADLPGRRL